MPPLFGRSVTLLDMFAHGFGPCVCFTALPVLPIVAIIGYTGGKASATHGAAIRFGLRTGLWCGLILTGVLTVFLLNANGNDLQTAAAWLDFLGLIALFAIAQSFITAVVGVFFAHLGFGRRPPDQAAPKLTALS